MFLLIGGVVYIIMIWFNSYYGERYRKLVNVNGLIRKYWIDLYYLEWLWLRLRVVILKYVIWCF